MDNWVALTQKDLQRISNRLNKARKEQNASMTHLERDADNCWENPNAEDNYLRIQEIMLRLEKKQNALDEVIDSLSRIIDQVKNFEAI